MKVVGLMIMDDPFLLSLPDVAVLPSTSSGAANIENTAEEKLARLGGNLLATQTAICV